MVNLAQSNRIWEIISGMRFLMFGPAFESLHLKR